LVLEYMDLITGLIGELDKVGTDVLLPTKTDRVRGI
jgi:uncharacterized membrane protein YagU involved in acid resistance